MPFSSAYFVVSARLWVNRLYTAKVSFAESSSTTSSVLAPQARQTLALEVSCSQGSFRPAQMAAFPLSSPAALMPTMRIGRAVAMVSSSDCSELRKPNWLWQ